MKEKKISFTTKEDGKLLELLAAKLPDFSKKTIKNYIKFKMVKVNKKFNSNSSLLVPMGSEITLYFDKEIKEKIPFEIVYEDEDLIAINKPNGLLSISNNEEKERTSFYLVSDYIKKKNPRAKLFVVHRLDQETSGVLLFSKNLKLKEKLQENWNFIVKKREYIAIVNGKIAPKGHFETYLTENHNQFVYSTKNKEIGKLAITDYKLLKSKNNYSMLEVNISTGRRNQIRVHLSESGHPIVGDKKYHSNDNTMKRLALHAFKLILVDPRTGKDLVLEAKIPKEFNKLFDTKN